jgi:hypothetical protein
MMTGSHTTDFRPPTTQQSSSGWDADWDANDEDDEKAAACAAEDLVTPREEPAPAWIDRVLLKEKTPVVETASGWGWGTALLHAATDGIHTITSTVGEGLSEVIDTVHTAVNIPTPEELARLPYAEKVQLEQKVDDVKESWPASDHDDCDSAMEEESDDAAATRSDEEQKSQLQVRRQRHKCTKRHAADDSDQRQSPPPPPQTSTHFPFGGLFGLQSLVNTSLDVLESVGKRTFDAVTVEEANSSNVGAHQRRRFFLTPEQSTLSDALREQRDSDTTGGDRQATASSSSTPSLQ